MDKTLGKLERVELRDIWLTEDRDFTPWLAKEENLSILSETIDIELELEAQEKDVGPFRADILCKNTDDDSWVLIENQVERTDHRHLGQLLTYAAGLQTVTIVWVAEKFTEEHRAALDWLNKITDDHFRFFGLEVELWRINDSIPAPKFNVISKPNNWSKSITQAAERISADASTETKGMQLRYWMELAKFLENNHSKLRIRTPRPQHWFSLSIGRSGVKTAALLNTREKRIGVELSLSSEETAKPFFHLLMKEKDAIEKEVGSELVWKELPDKTTSRILLYKQADPTDEANWPEQHAWLRTTLEKFDKVFRERVRKLDASDWESEAA
jgi:hypothetical protein